MTVDTPTSVKPRRVSREELYALVWKFPLTRLAEEFGITGTGLAKICRRLAIPCPPRGYWAKKEASKPVIPLSLQARATGVPQWAEIYPSPPRVEPPAAVLASIAAATATVRALTVPHTLDDLHPKVKAWVEQHKREQKARAEKLKRYKHGFWGAIHQPLDELTVRDLYRFRVTSAIFKGVEKAGATVEEAFISGKVTFRVDGQKVECSIAEKMLKSFLRTGRDAEKWTAYPEFHQSGLRSSGLLRVTFKTYLPGPQLNAPGTQPQWIETPTKKMAEMLSDIVGAIIGAGRILVEHERQIEEAQRRRQDEEVRRQERLRLRELDARRWARFQKCAADWEERTRLLAFVDELQRRLQADGDGQEGDRKLSEWIAWAHEKVETFDPFREGIRGLFESIDRAQ